MKLIILILLFPILANAEVTYTKDALPIFKERCSICHNSNNMPDKNWLDYNIAFKAKDKIKDRVYTKKDMPMGNATNMTNPEREIIKNWVDQGAKK